MVVYENGNKVVIENMMATAVYDESEENRYSLPRVWNPRGKRIVFVMINPSVADELVVDSAVARCMNTVLLKERFRNKYGSVEIVNLWPQRVKDSKQLRREYSETNTEYVREAFKDADMIVIAWGRSVQPYEEMVEAIEEFYENNPHGVWCCHDKDGLPAYPRFFSDEAEFHPYPMELLRQ